MTNTCKHWISEPGRGIATVSEPYVCPYCEIDRQFDEIERLTRERDEARRDCLNFKLYGNIAGYAGETDIVRLSRELAEYKLESRLQHERADLAEDRLRAAHEPGCAHSSINEVTGLCDSCGLRAFTTPPGSGCFYPNCDCLCPEARELKRQAEKSECALEWQTQCDKCGNKSSLGRGRNLKCYCGGVCRDIPDAGGWRLIEQWDSDEDAPVDVLVAEPTENDRFAVGEAKWHGERDGWYWSGNDPSDSWGHRIYPTHWMPLPGPPSRTGASHE